MDLVLKYDYFLSLFAIIRWTYQNKLGYIRAMLKFAYAVKYRDNQSNEDFTIFLKNCFTNYII